MSTFRTRFAPSPTGRLHLGNVRVAVFNWLLTRKHGGAFVIRVEDTDTDRNVEGSEAAIFEDLRWLGLEWDEGPDGGGPHGPYRQSERSVLYREAAEELLADSKAYRCFCTDEELALDVEQTASGSVRRYPGRCRELDAAKAGRMAAEGRAHAIRFALPGGDIQVNVVDDIRGSITFPISDFDDFVILRRDGRPTYNFAVVVDDAGMEISHVIRGVGHLSNTPKQALLFDGFGHPRPVFAHLPTVLAPGGGKLSKRTGASSVEELRTQGYHPDGIVNYLSLLGWSSSDEREVLEREELIAAISLDRVGASDTKYDPDKLRWTSGQHIQKMDPAALLSGVATHVDSTRFPLNGERLSAAAEALRSRLTTFGDIGQHLESFFYPTPASLAAAGEVVRADDQSRTVIGALGKTLQALKGWSPEALNESIRDTGVLLEVKGRELYRPMRLAVSGQESGPDLGLVMTAVGREEVLNRVERARGEGSH